MKTIFTVTTVNKDSRRLKQRTIGWFPEFEDARAEVLNNTFDMSEFGYYRWVVVEEVRPGIYPIPVENEVWYEWVGYKVNPDGTNQKVMRYVQLEGKPDEFRGKSNFSIG